MTVVVATQDIELGECLGKGNFGTVYSGRVRPFGKVAIKVIKPHGKGPFDMWRGHLLREADRLHAAEHQHVVRFHGCAYDDSEDQVFIVTELCAGSVASVAGSMPMPLATLHGIVGGALLGLEALHARGMIHRDIKPGNILLTSAGRAKLADFGLVTDNLEEGYGTYEGYYFHLAPEVFEKRTTSTKTDVWAMGMTVYRLLNGEHWWKDFVGRCRVEDEREGVKAFIKKGRFAQKLPWMPHVPDPWRRFVRAALKDDSGERFQNATTMLSAHASLPTGPSWTCEAYDTGTIRWSSLRGSRRSLVEWSSRTKTSQRVRKWTEPVDGHPGRARTGGDFEGLSAADAQRQAESFLGTRTT